MPLRAFKCEVDLTIHAVSAPGVRLSNKEDLYLNVCLLGQQRRTRLVAPLFPLLFDDHLKFEKTFKYCRDPSDVVELLSGLHCLIELIQVGRENDTEVLAQYNTNAREFLYPIPDGKLTYHSAQRDLFMTTWNLPTIISPQLQFCTSTSITETRTPSLDILREFNERYGEDPIIDLKSNQVKIRSKSANSKRKSKKRNKISKHFEQHTISSAIKSNFSQTDVQNKLKELNTSVNSQVEIASRVLNDTNKPQPFVVGHVSSKLIGRQPTAHQLLADGLTLTRKSRERSTKRTKSPTKSTQSSRSQSRSHSADAIKSKDRSKSPVKTVEEPTTETTQNVSQTETASDNKYNSNSSAIFDRTDALAKKVALETTRENRFINSPDYLNRSYSSLYPHRSLVDPYADYYPLNRSFDHYAPLYYRHPIYRYDRLYPWYYRYSDYLADLDEELRILKLRRKYLNR